MTPGAGVGPLLVALLVVLPAAALYGTAWAVHDHDPADIVAAVAAPLVGYALLHTAVRRERSGPPPHPSTRTPSRPGCPDCGAPTGDGPVRWCCPSPDTRTRLEAAADDRWVADMRRLAALDRLDAWIADEQAAAEAARRPVRRRRRVRAVLAARIWRRDRP